MNPLVAICILILSAGQWLSLTLTYFAVSELTSRGYGIIAALCNKWEGLWPWVEGRYDCNNWYNCCRNDRNARLAHKTSNWIENKVSKNCFRNKPLFNREEWIFARFSHWSYFRYHSLFLEKQDLLILQDSAECCLWKVCRSGSAVVYLSIKVKLNVIVISLVIMVILCILYIHSVEQSLLCLPPKKPCSPEIQPNIRSC